MTLDYVLKTIAILVIIWSVLNVVLTSRLTRVNTMVLSFALLAIVIAVFTAVPLLAAYLLHSEALTLTRFTDLLLLLALASTLSALFLESEEPTVNVLEKLGMGRIWAETGFVFVHGLVTALLFILVASYVPGIELATGVALAAGLISAFAFYFAELVFVHSGSADTEEMALMESSLEDEED